MRLDAKWTSTKEKFLTAFENKVLDLIGLRDTESAPSDQNRFTWLRDALAL